MRKNLNADAVAHGSTGAGNDQVRFDMIFHIMIPGVEIITPIRDLKLSREEEIDYLKEKGVEMNFEKAHYSINKGLWGTSVGGKETLVFQRHAAGRSLANTSDKDRRRRSCKLEFEKGELTGSK